ETVQRIEKGGAEAIFLQGDVSDPQAVRRIFDAILEKWGRLDVLINNAGTSQDKTILKMPQEAWDRVLAINLNGSFYCLKQASHAMVEQRAGSILTIGSYLGFTGAYGAANYSAAKAGLVALTKSAAREMGRFGVCVNLVLPGFHNTDMNKNL